MNLSRDGSEDGQCCKCISYVKGVYWGIVVLNFAFSLSPWVVRSCLPKCFLFCSLKSGFFLWLVGQVHQERTSPNKLDSLDMYYSVSLPGKSLYRKAFIILRVIVRTSTFTSHPTHSPGMNVVTVLLISWHCLYWFNQRIFFCTASVHWLYWCWE